MTETEAVNKIEKIFENSVNAHKIADVEVGCFLSSGVDSSYVSTYFADQKTFTVGFDFGEKYNEISWAKSLSEKIGVEHHTHLISSEEFWDAVPTVQYHMDQPLADPSCIALYFVSRLASQYVKVVLSGEVQTSCSEVTPAIMTRGYSSCIRPLFRIAYARRFVLFAKSFPTLREEIILSVRATLLRRDISAMHLCMITNRNSRF